MGKVVGTVGVIVGAVALAATGIGAIAAPGLAGALTIGGIKASTLLLAGTALQAVGQSLTKQPKASAATIDRLHANLVADAPRKFAFGRTAFNTDMRYQEWWGNEQQYCSQVFALASHHCESVDEIWLDDKLAWTAAGGTQGAFVGYLRVQVQPQATTASRFYAGWSGRWGANATYAGCATLYLEFKVTGNGKKGTSPFSSSITSRVTVIGKGARLPDPRFDSTAGGSGAVRVGNQSTWAWAQGEYEAGRNPALALLFYLLGWRIQNPVTGQWGLAVGCGVPVDRIDLGSFITAANLCDEPVQKADGSYEPRYRCDGVFSEADDRSQVIAAFETTMNAKLRDSAGRFSLQVLHNDLGTPVVDFTDDDVLGDFTWTAGNDLNDRKNVVRGRYTNAGALYQLTDFPPIRLASLDGIDRIDSVDLALVQSGSQAQRLGKQRLQRMQYQGAFAAEFNAKGWAVKDGDIVRLTFSALGFDKKLFRVAEGLIDPTGVVPLVLVEENTAIYAWDRSEAAAVQAAEPNTFNPLMLPIIAALGEAGRTAEWPAITGEGKPEDYATNSALPGSPMGPDRTVAEVLSTVDVNVEAILAQALRQDDFVEVVQNLTMVEGQPVGVKFLAFRDQATDPATGFASAADFAAVFVKAKDGTGYSMKLDAVKAGNATFSDVLAGYNTKIGGLRADIGDLGSVTGTLSQNLAQIGALAGNTSAKVTTLNQAFASPSGLGFAKALTTVDVNGRIVGYAATSDGKEGVFHIVADLFLVSDPDDPKGAVAPLTVVNKVVHAKNFEADIITYDALVDKFAGSRQLLDPAGGFQVLPGGFILQWGRYRQQIGSEVSFSVLFAKPFPTAVMSVIATPYIAVPSDTRDLWLQNLGEPSVNGASFFTQAANTNDRKIDGFDWMAFGK